MEPGDVDGRAEPSRRTSTAVPVLLEPSDDGVYVRASSASRLQAPVFPGQVF